MMKIYHSKQIYLIEEMRSTCRLDQVCFTKFRCICSFYTFPDELVGGGKIKNKDQLSLVEAIIEAELGNSSWVGSGSD